MKWTPSQAQAAAQQNPANWPQIICAYGDDGGLARNLIKTLAAASQITPDDPFNYTSISIDDLTQEPARLLEAAQTIGFGGGLRLIKIEGITPDMGAPAQNALTNATKACLEANLQDVIILIAAPGLDAKAALPKAIEKAPNAAAIRCFQANVGDLRSHIQTILKHNNKTIAPDALTWLTENLGSDQAITQSELEKLCIYALDEPEIALPHCLAVVAGAPAVNVFSLCDAVGNRDLKTVDSTLQTLTNAGEDLNMIFALVVRHLRRIAQAQEAVASGMPPSAAIKTLSPPVFFNQSGFIQQMNAISPAKAAKITAKALEVQTQARQGKLPETLLYSRAILSFAA